MSKRRKVEYFPAISIDDSRQTEFCPICGRAVPISEFAEHEKICKRDREEVED